VSVGVPASTSDVPLTTNHDSRPDTAIRNLLNCMRSVRLEPKTSGTVSFHSAHATHAVRWHRCRLASGTI
jgi:hypothetical protein